MTESLCAKKRGDLKEGGEGVGSPGLDLETEEPTDTRVLQDERGMGEPEEQSSWERG